MKTERQKMDDLDKLATRRGLNAKPITNQTGTAAPVAPVDLGADRNTVTQPQPEEHELQLGDVLRSSGSGKDYIVDRMLSDGRVSCTPLDPEPIRYERADGTVCEYNTFKTLDIPAKSKVVLIERRGEAGVIKFIASKVARREVENTGNTTTRTQSMKTNKNGTINGIKLPPNPYDAKAWQEIASGGTKDEIGKRLLDHSVKNWPKDKQRVDPATFAKFADEYVADMKEAGLTPNIGKPFKAVPLDAPAVALSVPKAAPMVNLAPEGPATAKVPAPVESEGMAALKRLAKAQAKKSPAARAAAFIAKDGPKAGSKLRPLAPGGSKPVSKPRGGLAAGV